MDNWKQTLLPFFLLSTSVFLDGFVASSFSTYLNTDIGLIVPRLVFLVFVILSFHYKQNFMYINAALIGLIMDAYYVGFLGVYMVAFIATVSIVSSLKQLINPNVMSYTLVSILGLTASESLIYGIMRILGITTISFQTFIVTRLSATLLFNAVIMLVFSYFIHQIVVNLLDEIKIR